VCFTTNKNNIIVQFYSKTLYNFKLWTEFNLLLMNLILAELLVSLYGIPVDFLASLQGGWKMGPTLCKATGFILTTLGNACGLYCP
jgi:hypothetical protein